jgi:toxin ParE1/3/4
MPNKALQFHPLARNEASLAYIWYRDRDPKVAKRFDEDLTRYFELVERRPMLFEHHLVGTRRCVMKDFPYQIIFVDTGKVRFVVAVAHSMRKPGYWKKRLK